MFGDQNSRCNTCTLTCSRGGVSDTPGHPRVWSRGSQAFVYLAFQVLGTDHPDQISKPMVLVLEGVWDACSEWLGRGRGRTGAEVEVEFIYSAVSQLCCVHGWAPTCSCCTSLLSRAGSVPGTPLCSPQTSQPQGGRTVLRNPVHCKSLFCASRLKWKFVLKWQLSEINKIINITCIYKENISLIVPGFKGRRKAVQGKAIKSIAVKQL